ncbi:MAG: hypothetical protein U0519_03765 [Candidatus Gracilibacteria bacterium]
MKKFDFFSESCFSRQRNNSAAGMVLLRKLRGMNLKQQLKNFSRLPNSQLAAPEKPEQKEQEVQSTTEPQSAEPSGSGRQDKNWLEELLPEEKRARPRRCCHGWRKHQRLPSRPSKMTLMKFMKGLDGEYETDLFTGAATYKLPPYGYLKEEGKSNPGKFYYRTRVQ